MSPQCHRIAPPKLTIAIPTYERPDTLKETLECLAAQQDPHVEVLVIDNGSTSYDILEMFALCPDFTFATFLRKPKNTGIDGNVKSCIEKAHGEFIWFLSDDDLLEPGAVAYVLDLLKSTSPLGCCVLNYDVYDANISTRLACSAVRPHTDEVASLFCRLSFISILVINRGYLMGSGRWPSFDCWLGSLYYHYAIGIFLGLQYGHCFGSRPVVKFRSNRSTLGGTLDAALNPYRIFRSLLATYQFSPPWSPGAFIRYDVEPWVRHHKKLGRLSWAHLMAIGRTFGLSSWHGWKILILYALPQWLVTLWIKRKKAPTRTG